MPAVPTPGYVGFARIFWMFVGPMVLAMLAYSTATSPGDSFATADLAYFIVLAGMLGARKLEFHSGHAQTAEGDPATPHDLRRYLMTASAIGVGAWIVAKIAARFVFAA